MPQLLLINPNTSAAVTELLAHHAGALAPHDGVLHARTAPFGEPYIASAAACALAEQAVPAAWASHVAAHGEPDAVLVACFGDPGVAALRARTRVPVLGLAEVAMRQAQALAATHGGPDGRYAIVTGGAAWRPMLWALAERLGLAARLAEVVTVAPSGAELMADPAAAQTLLRAACHEALARPGVQAIVIGGAALADLAAPLSAELQVPLVDNVQVGLRAAWHTACSARPTV
ncbi:aspartate/glutamate racemase family protein [Aquabacterium sp. OR-4]|uniref:aspartate/glutamate racemase family protein n=1 Tax=Aquabacterium sp. OR-4 TaxID=2978127 RepID=UPI0021B3F48F|nr:aspartate/glutamate racemase family protein [Aquabacterium sp. OR-4]MDT7834342.1 aspartate/glutamate racemase family protein [Aquabacterium sp. OR-4]